MGDVPIAESFFGGGDAAATKLVFGRFEGKSDAKTGAVRSGGEFDLPPVAFDNDSVAND
jgi:hypothetical protein